MREAEGQTVDGQTEQGRDKGKKQQEEKEGTVTLKGTADGRKAPGSRW